MADKEVTSTNGGIAIGGNVTNSQVVKGTQVNLQQRINQASSEGLSAADVAGLLGQLQELVQASSLADDAKTKANRHIETARDELESDKDFAAKPRAYKKPWIFCSKAKSWRVPFFTTVHFF